MVESPGFAPYYIVHTLKLQTVILCVFHLPDGTFKLVVIHNTPTGFDDGHCQPNHITQQGADLQYPFTLICL